MSSVDLVTFRAPSLFPCLIHELQNELRPVILVPQSFTLAVENAILNSMPQKGFIGIRVFSPASLIQEINERAGKGETRHITQDGRIMLIARLLLEHEKELEFYHRSVHQPGLAQRFSAQIEAFQAAGLSSDQLLSKLPASSSQKKLHDIALIWSAYQSWKKNNYTDPYDTWQDAMGRLAVSGLLADAHLLIYGFDTLTDRLTNLILHSAPLARKITLGLICDPSAPDRDIFINVLHSIARFRHGHQDLPVCFRFFASPSAGEPDLRFVESTLFSRHVPDIPSMPEMKNVFMMQAKNSVQECEYIAQTLISWHRHGFSWSEMAVAVCEEETLPRLLPRILQSCGIPFTLRTARSVMLTDLIRFFLAVLRAMRDRWRREDMLQIFRSGFMPLTEEEEMDLENYVYAHGTDRNRWLHPFPENEMQMRSIEPVRSSLLTSLSDLKTRLTDRSCTGRDAAIFLYHFLLDWNVYSRLLEAESTALSSGRDEWADLNRQSWKVLMDVLDQLAVFADHTHLSLLDLTSMLTSSLSVHAIKSLPQSTDTVLISAPSLFLSEGFSGMIVCGLQQTAAPADFSLLTDQECLHLRSNHIDIGITRDEMAAHQKQDIYQVVSLARRKLLLSCSTASPDGSPLYPSQAFRSFSKCLTARNPKQMLSGFSDDVLRPLSPALTLEELSVRLRDSADHGNGFLTGTDAASMTWQSALSWLYHHPHWHKKTVEMLGGLQPVSDDLWSIRPDQAERLYPSGLSPSFAETAALCPCQNWAQRGLLLHPRTEFSFSPDQQGAFIHEVLQIFFHHAQQDAQWPFLPPSRVQALLNTILREKTRIWADGPLGVNTVHRYQGASVIRTIRTLCTILTDSLHHQPHFIPWMMEAGFGEYGNRRFPPVHLSTPSGRSVTLSGVIDRIDLLNTQDGKKYFLIQDYKSSEKEIRQSSIESGTDLQLPLYLLAAQQALPEYEAAGSVYQPVREYVLESDTASLSSELRRALAVRGIILDNEEIQQALRPLKISRTRAGSDLLPALSPKAMLDLTEKSISVFGALVDWQFSGVTSPNPLMDGDRLPCETCFLHPACSWDPRLPGSPCRKKTI